MKIYAVIGPDNYMAEDAFYFIRLEDAQRLCGTNDEYDIVEIEADENYKKVGGE